MFKSLTIIQWYNTKENTIPTNVNLMLVEWHDNKKGVSKIWQLSVNSLKFTRK